MLSHIAYTYRLTQSQTEQISVRVCAFMGPGVKFEY